MVIPELKSLWLPEALALLRCDKSFALAVVTGPKGHLLLGQRAILTSTSAMLSVGSPVHQEIDTSAGRAEVLVLPYGAPDEAWIFGAGHIARELAPLTTRLGWRTIICDDRSEYASRERFADVHDVIVGDFAELAERCAKRAGAWVILLTRGHEHDEQILKRLAQTHCRYIGMIGSKRRIAAVRERLSKQDLAGDFFDRLHAPIGLEIGADSPAEIAVSILAEMIAVRRGHDVKEPQKSCLLDTSNVMPIWERLESERVAGHPGVLATIVARRGATPRGVGAQMAIFADGTSFGTIGGGCGEEEIKSAAKRLMLSNGVAEIVEVDLTGDPAAESTADICGGRYSVLLEVVLP